MIGRVKPVLFALATLCGCATNALRVEYAGDVAVAGKTAASASRGLLDKVEETRTDTRIELASADPECAALRPVVRAQPVVGAAAPPAGAICLPAGAAAGPGDVPLDLRPLDRDIAPTLDLIAALVDYSDALAQIVEPNPIDAAQSIEDAHATALAAQNAIVALLGAPGGPIPGANDPRVSSIFQFVSFLGQLKREQDQVNRLRALVRDGPDTTALIQTLREQMSAWENRRKADSALGLAVNATLARRLIELRPPVPPEVRRAALTAYYGRQGVTRSADKLYPAVNRLLAALQTSNADFKRVLEKEPKLTSKESARVREIARQRIVKALDIVTAVASGFRGV